MMKTMNAMYEYLVKTCIEKGFEHYEISNPRPAKSSLHKTIRLTGISRRTWHWTGSTFLQSDFTSMEYGFHKAVL